MKKKKQKQSKPDTLFNILNYAFFGFFTLVCVLPFYYLFINTISDNDLVAKGAVIWHPMGIHFNNYLEVLKIEGFGRAAAGDFTMVFGAITSFKNACSGMINGIIEVLNRGRYFSNYLEFMELEGDSHKGNELIETKTEQGVEIEFRHVSFRYPNQNRYALKDIIC